MPLRHERRTPPTPRSWASLIKPAANHAPQPGQDMDSSISRPTFSAGRMATSHFNDDDLEKTYLVRPRASAATTHLATVPCMLPCCGKYRISKIQRDMDSHVGLAGQRRNCLARDFESSCSCPGQKSVDNNVVRSSTQVPVSPACTCPIRSAGIPYRCGLHRCRAEKTASHMV